MAGRPGTRTLGLSFAVAIALVGSAAAEVTVRDPGTFVVDEAGVVDQETKQKLEAYLAELERKTTAQVKVLTVRTDEGEDIAAFAQRHFDLWKLGQKGKDNGALIVLDVDDHKVSILTGYGLEGTLPDSYCGTLRRKITDEYFRGGRYAQGLYQIAVAVANKVADESNVKLEGVPAIRHQVRQDSKLPATIGLLFFGTILILLFWSTMRREHHRRLWRNDLTSVWFWGRVLGDAVSSGGSSWSSSGSSGGFGGGGGSFGGGGASGGGGSSGGW